MNHGVEPVLAKSSHDRGMETKLAFPYFLGRLVAIGLDIEIKIASAGRIVRPPPEDSDPGGLAKSATDLFADDVSLWVGELHGP